MKTKHHKFFTLLAGLVTLAAAVCTSSASIGYVYQPKAPKCLTGKY